MLTLILAALAFLLLPSAGLGVAMLTTHAIERRRDRQWAREIAGWEVR